MKTQYRVAVVLTASVSLMLMFFGLITVGSASQDASHTVNVSAAANVHTLKASGTRKSKKPAHTGLNSPVISSAEARKTAQASDLAYFDQFKPADAAERKANAALIVAIGNKRGLSDRTIAVCVAVAIQESGLRNLTWGDADSLGLFQQRPSVKIWGTASQILDRTHAINAFYDSIVRYHDRDSLKMITIAMYVQGPNPTYYYRDWHWNDIATAIVAHFSTSKGNL